MSPLSGVGDDETEFDIGLALLPVLNEPLIQFLVLWRVQDLSLHVGMLNQIQRVFFQSLNGEAEKLASRDEILVLKAIAVHALVISPEGQEVLPPHGHSAV